MIRIRSYKHAYAVRLADNIMCARFEVNYSDRVLEGNEIKFTTVIGMNRR